MHIKVQAGASLVCKGCVQSKRLACRIIVCVCVLRCCRTGFCALTLTHGRAALSSVAAITSMPELTAIISGVAPYCTRSQRHTDYIYIFTIIILIKRQSPSP